MWLALERSPNSHHRSKQIFQSAAQLLRCCRTLCWQFHCCKTSWNTLAFFREISAGNQKVIRPDFISSPASRLSKNDSSSKHSTQYLKEFKGDFYANVKRTGIAQSLGQVNFFFESSESSWFGDKINQIEPLRLGPGSFASKLMESSRVKMSKIVWISLDLFSAEPSQYCTWYVSFASYRYN